MGLRHRSIRLRVGVLITVPVLCLLALYGFVLSITLGSAVSQKHATTLRNNVADPVAAFQQEVAQERGDALLSLADPTDTEMASKLGVQESATQHALAALTAALNGPGVASLAAPPEQAAIRTLLNATKKLSFIRGNISDDAITMRAALADYDAIIDAGYPVIDEALDQLSSVPIVTQARDVINLDRASQATQAEWDLLAADMTQRTFPNPDRLTFAALANQRRSLIDAGVPELDPQYRALLARYVSPASTHAVTAAETRVINTPWHRGVPPARLSSSKMVFADYSLALGNALLHTGDVLQNKDQHNTNTVIIELLLAAGLGLLGTIVSISLSLIIGRGLIRQLRALRESALTLAHDKLPSVISRLRAGDQVDLAEYAPSQASTGNEMEQVQNAFNIVQQTAVKAAVDEARLRRGISDVFRNLAGRSQSLLHRQLTLLDGMERRATEPAELEDLFRIDHLTTRMRRHAEGLIILSGETPARGWRQPVPLVDVLRAAVAEVEDYTRIRVLCRTNAAVAGHAVADVIHLIAELAENATVFSPPSTPVRIQGEIVGRGFAVEIEDRGLGISQTRMDEINANLASPPQFDLSGSDRLGLFIAGQLAQRHNIKITLRSSVYGGTTAIVLIPTGLVVEEDTYERDPALPAGQGAGSALPNRIAGRHAALEQSGSGLPGSPSGGNGYASTQVGSELDTDASRLWLPVGAEGPAAPVDSVAAVEPEPVRLTWSGESAGASETGGSGEREPGKLSWSDGSYRQTEREAVRIGWSDDGSSGSQHESATGWPSAPSGEADGSVTKTQVSELGLPVRVRQANLAPQLRRTAPPPAADTSLGSGFFSGATTASGSPRRRPGDSDIDPFAPRRSASQERAASDSGGHLASPEAARSTMSALQRGWQLGRSAAEQGAGPAEPSDGSSPGGSTPSGYSPSGHPPTADSAHQHENENE